MLLLSGFAEVVVNVRIVNVYLKRERNNKLLPAMLCLLKGTDHQQRRMESNYSTFVPLVYVVNIQHCLNPYVHRLRVSQGGCEGSARVLP